MTKQDKKISFGLIMVVYLLGIFMGALDTGIVTPARTIIQNFLMVDEKTGIWMITIYTLAYAASIPIMGKLADKYGRKYIYLVSIFLFGTGSLLCGLASDFGGFPLLLIARAIQAIGGGGIVPVATAEFGTTFPAEKRGMALGLVGGVYGIANIFGASAGSAILDLFGKTNWQFIFYINIPITVFILIAGFLSLPNTKEQNVKKIDIFGITTLTVMVLALLYGLKNINFFDFGNTFVSTSVYPYLILFVVLLPVFIFAEKKAEDPVLNLAYFKNINIVITLLLSFVTGIAMMGMIFVPQFSENALKIASGSGGYFVIILGVFAGIGAPVSGKLIDRFGVKIVLGFGFITSLVGGLFLIFVTTNFPSLLTVVTSLVIIGIGMGFTMGTPLNYMMLDNTKTKESNSALATLSLVRSIGTAIAPAIMIGFIAQAGLSIQTNVMDLLPKAVSVPPLPYAQELTDKFNQLKTNAATKDKFSGMDMPDLTSMQKVEINMNGSSDYKMPDDLLELMKSSDVTTITENSKTLADRMFGEMTPKIVQKIETGIDNGLGGMESALSDMDKTIVDMQSGYDGIGKGIDGMSAAVTAQQEALTQLENVAKMLSSMPAGGTPGSGEGMPAMPAIVDMIPANIKAKMPQVVIDELSAVKTVEDLNKKISELQSAITTLKTKIDEAQASQIKMQAGLDGLETARVSITVTVSEMGSLKAAVPTAFNTARKTYLNEIDKKKTVLEDEFQKTLNGGFSQVYSTVAISTALAFLLLLFYRNNQRETETVK